MLLGAVKFDCRTSGLFRAFSAQFVRETVPGALPQAVASRAFGATNRLFQAQNDEPAMVTPLKNRAKFILALRVEDNQSEFP
jgi:hypothetical protein